MPKAPWLLLLLSPAVWALPDSRFDDVSEGFPFPSLQPWFGIILKEINSSLPLADKCAEDSARLKRAFEEKLLWASRMVDASATHVTGALWGLRYQLGSFDGCLSAGASSPLGGARYSLVKLAVRHPSPHSPSRPWSAVMELRPEEDARAVLSGRRQLPDYFPPGEVFLAQCVPISCSPAALEAAARATLLHSPAAPEVSVPPQLCQDSVEVSQPASAAARMFWFIMLLLTAVAFVSPYFGWSWYNWRDHLKDLARADSPLEGMDLGPLSGIRFLSSFFTIIAHAMLIALMGPVSNYSTANEVDISDPQRTLLVHAHCFTYTFMFMSGLLLVLNYKTIDAKRVILTRFLRLVPSYAVVIVFIAVAVPSLASGPLWKRLVLADSEGCAKWWWANLLFINNYLGLREDGQHLCMMQSWFLAADMQLVVLSVLLAPRRRSLRTLLLLLMVAMAVPFLIWYSNRWPYLILREPRVLDNYYTKPKFVYGIMPTHVRAPPFIAGLVFGVLMLRLKERALRLSACATYLLTGLGMLLTVGLFLSSIYVNKLERLDNALLQAASAAFTPVLFTSSIGLLLIVFTFGEHTLVRGFLTWQPMVTLSRLTYAAGLTNMIHINVVVGVIHDSKKMDAFSGFSQAFADNVFVTMYSFWLYMVVEAPARKMTKSLIDRIYKKDKSVALKHQKERDPTKKEKGKDT